MKKENELKKFVNDYNLITTSTTRRDMLSTKGKETLEVNIDNSVNLYSIIEEFNNQYNIFNENLKKLQKLNIGKKVNFEYYRANHDVLALYVECPYNINSLEEMVYLGKDGNCTFHKVYKENSVKIDKEKTKKIKIESSTIKGYLELCQKYKDFLTIYQNLKNAFIFGDGCTTLFSRIDGDILEQLKEFELSFGQHYFNTEYLVSCYVELGELKVLKKGPTILDSEKYNEINKEDLLRKIYVNENHLSKIYGETPYVKQLKRSGI